MRVRARILAGIGAALALACSGGDDGAAGTSAASSSSSGSSSGSTAGGSTAGGSTAGGSTADELTSGTSTSAGPSTGESTTEAEACDEALFGGAGIFRGPFTIGAACDAVIVCTSDPAGVQALFPAATCEGAGYPCERGDRCQVGGAGEVSAAAWASYCAASLLPEVSAVKCVVWGP